LNQFKRLAGQTIIYGFGTIAPRLLNFLLLTPLYTRIFDKTEYGVFTELYAYIVFLLVILTYGMETGFFRFAKGEKDFKKVYSTSLVSLFATSLIFVLATVVFSEQIATLLDYEHNANYIRWFCIIVSIDAFTSIPFAKLRYEGKAKKFGILKIINVLVNIGFNALFFLVFPSVYKTNPEIIKYVYNPEMGVGYVFIANLIASIVTLILLIPDLFSFKIRFDFDLLKRMMMYSLPLLVVGIAGTVNEVLDKILMKHLVSDPSSALEQVGIYGANYKLAVLMTIFIQMFRYAAEPFFFSRMDDKDARHQYAAIMKYFIIIGLFIFLGVMLYIDIVKYFIGTEFHSGLRIVPIILLANLFLGILYNQSIWYKLTNLTKYGAWISLIGAGITIILNIILVPFFGYMGAAWATLICYTSMIVITYFMGQKFYTIDYDLKNISIYFVIALGIYFINRALAIESFNIQILVSTVFLLVYALIIYKKENILMIFNK
jgi:O-antigen/teichoic acid export membrane protein